MESKHNTMTTELDESIVADIENALKKSALDIVLRRIDGITFPLEDIDKAVKLLTTYDDDRTISILLFSLIDDTILHAMSHHINKKMLSAKKNIFSNQNLLSSANDRITMAYALNWITDSVFHDLDLFRKIRNRFAHNIDIHSLDEEPVKGWLTSIQTHEEIVLNSAERSPLKVKTIKIRKKEDLSSSETLIIRGIIVLFRAVLQILVSPAAHSLGLTLKEVTDNQDRLPPALRDLNKLLFGQAMTLIFEPTAEGYREFFIKHKGNDS